MDIGSVLSAVASGAGGGIVGGVLGLGKVWLQGRQEKAEAQEKRETLKAQNDHDFRMAGLEIERSKQEAQLDLDKLDLTNLGDAAASQDKEIEALKPALEDSYRWVKSLLAVLFGAAVWSSKMVRIVLTVALVVFTWDIYVDVRKMVGGFASLPVSDLVAIFRSIVNSVIALTGTAVTFWFVTRPVRK